MQSIPYRLERYGGPCSVISVKEAFALVALMSLLNAQVLVLVQ